jgi:hypothetical protein
MASAWTSWKRAVFRLRAEPVVHFLVLGALLFAAHRWLVDDPRSIVVTPGLQRELSRRFEDVRGRKPDASELSAELRQWERDEALYQEALRRRLDRDDPTVRTALVDKMRALAGAEVRERAPSDEELAAWLAAHRDRYEAPLRYDFEYFQFPSAEADARGELERIERALGDGATPSALGRPLLGGNLTVADMQGRIPPQLAARLPGLPPGQWQKIDTDSASLLARVKRISGGLPNPDVLRPRLVADWTEAARRDAVERLLQQTVDRYSVENRP